jgi:hemoglobin
MASSVYDQIGGREAVAAAVEQFYARVLGDSELAPYFARTDMSRQKAHMRAFLAAAVGGPDVYGGRDMRAAHAHAGITSASFDRVVVHLVATLESLGVPAPIVEAIGGKLVPLRAQIVTAA